MKDNQGMAHVGCIRCNRSCKLLGPQLFQILMYLKVLKRARENELGEKFVKFC